MHIMHNLLSISRIKILYRRKSTTIPCNFCYIEKIDSTQMEAKRYLNSTSVNEPYAIFAGSQTNGYGKGDRSFYSPDNCGIYVSVIIPKFKIKYEHVGLLTISFGSKILEILEKYYPKKNFSLKWVNDILLDGKKVAGILVEKHLTVKRNDSLIIGIGINLRPFVLPNELKGIATSIDDINKIDPDKLSADLIAALFQVVSKYETRIFLPAYRKRLILTGRQVKIRTSNRILQGHVLGIDDNGGLLLKLNDKNVQTLVSGDVIKVIY